MTAARYINKELLATFAVTLLVLFVLAVGGRFIGYLQDAAAGKYAADALMTILALRLPGFLQLMLPFAFTIALLLTFGRLHSEHEMAVLLSSGASPGRVLAWTAPAVLLLAALVAYLSLVATPACNASLDAFLAEQRSKADFSRLSPGVFNRMRGGQGVTYLEGISADGRTLNEVFVSEPGPGGGATTTWARRAEQYVDEATGSRFLVLKEGVRHEMRSRKSHRVVHFATLGRKMQSSPAPMVSDKEALPTRALLGQRNPAAAAELHWRIALPAFCILNCLIAFAAAPVRPGQGRFGKIVPGVLATLAYYLTLLANQNALATSLLPSPLGLWPAHLLFAILAAFLLRRLGRPTWR